MAHHAAHDPWPNVIYEQLIGELLIDPQLPPSTPLSDEPWIEEAPTWPWTPTQ